MKKFARILCLLLAMIMVFGLVACGGGSETSESQSQTQGSESSSDSSSDSSSVGGEELDPYDQASWDIYNTVLGDFYTAYQAAKAATNDSERYAKMAIAEAKLMEAGVMLPLTTNGGNYAISRVAPYTATTVLWGNDSYRYHSVVIADSPIKASERDEMKAKWAELGGIGYTEWAKTYLTGKGYTLKDEYSLGYSSDPQVWDVLNTSRAADSEALVNCYDGLYEYDIANNLRPALATGHTVSEDGLTYTFTIRENAVWTDSQGRKVANVKADDFVAGLQHMMDSMAGLEYLIDGIIKNAHEYMAGEVGIEEVGVKAIDDRTLVYTLEAPCSYVLTMLGYGVFAPLCREYYVSKGGQFGADFNDEAETYEYGTSPDNIAYCGPYTITNFTAENTIVFTLNESYWNKDNVGIKKITWLFNNGEDVLKAYNDMKAGTIAGCGLNASAVEAAKTDGLFDTYVYTSSTDATSFMGFYNLNRVLFANVNDASAVVSSQTAEQAARTNKAMMNQNFRLALSMAADRGAYNAQSVGEALKLVSLRNCYTPGTFVKLAEEVTVSINGTDKTYAAGTFYGQIMQDQIDADGVKITVWDPEADGGIGSSDGFDGWYNPENAAEYLALAIAELAAEGVEISAENPIYIDLPCWTTNESYKNRGESYKQSVEASLGGKVIVNLVECKTSKEWYWAGYYAETGAEANYDMYDVSGWGPDYGDPATYLDTFLPDYAGYMVKCLGIF